MKQRQPSTSVTLGGALARRARRALGVLCIPALSLGAMALVSCDDDPAELDTTQTFRVTVRKVDGKDPPKIDAPLPANTGATNEVWEVEIEAIGPGGEPAPFEGFVNLSVRPGAVVSVQNDDGEDLGKNLRLSGGKASAQVTVTAVYGEARLWVEDLGYEKAPDGETPLCANGVNDDPDDDVFVDYPSDPGCAFADDNSELAGSFAAGTSPAVHHELPSIQNIQGTGSTTPYPFESISVNTAGPHQLIVTRYAKDGFYVTDLAGEDEGFNHLFVFTFSTPSNLRPCDRVTYLGGTISEFFGFTEMNFPSYTVDPLFEGEEDKCKIPEPRVLTYETIDSPIEMEKLESALVRIEGYHVSQLIGPNIALNNEFKPDQTNCDLNGDGKVDFDNEAEASCGNACSDNPECSEWTGFVARGNYKVSKEEPNIDGIPVTVVIQVQTEGAPQFSPVANRGVELDAVTGTLRNFSGGDLNWTVEARCVDDVVCDAQGCSDEIRGPKESCLDLRTLEDNDEGTN